MVRPLPAPVFASVPPTVLIPFNTGPATIPNKFLRIWAELLTIPPISIPNAPNPVPNLPVIVIIPPNPCKPVPRYLFNPASMVSPTAENREFITPPKSLAFSWLLAIFSSSATDVPNKSAVCFFCQYSILLNSSIPPNAFRVSFIIPSRSPSSANALALSKLIVLPNIAPNSNSFVIELSKSNKLSAIPLMVFIFVPNLAAYPAAFRIFSPPSLPNNAKASVELAKSDISAVGIIPFCLANC